jgi:hypothetical protein
MAKYIVEQMAQVWYRIEVDIDSNDENIALELGMEKLMNDEGAEIPFTFEWQDETSIEEVV